MAKSKSNIRKDLAEKPVPSTPEEAFDLSKSTDIIRLIKISKDESEIKSFLKKDLVSFISGTEISKNYEILFLYDSTGSIIDYDLDKIYDSLIDLTTKTKDILLFIHSSGGEVEPAYLISKLCKEVGRKFSVVVPRKAKSAATLISLGADEIHMGPISQLGPIDPQIGGRPALGLGNAIEYLAKLVTKHEKSSEMFSKYLSDQLDLKQLGHFERVTESAVQYAERLLKDKQLPDGRTINEVAKDLTYFFKDHGFVIDQKEAATYLGKYIKTDTPEIKFAEQVFNRLSDFNLYLGSMRKKRLVISGSIEKGALIFIPKES